jgi:hypothetical protein
MAPWSATTPARPTYLAAGSRYLQVRADKDDAERTVSRYWIFRMRTHWLD